MITTDRVVLIENNKEYILDAQIIYEEGQKGIWINPFTGQPLPEAFIVGIIERCCPDIYVSYVSRTHSIDRKATIGRVITDYILETGATVDDDIVHIDHNEGRHYSLYRNILDEPLYKIDIDHFVLARGNFDTDIEHTTAHKKLYDYLLRLPRRTYQENELLGTLSEIMSPPVYVRNTHFQPHVYEVVLPPKYIVTQRPIIQPIPQNVEYEVIEEGPRVQRQVREPVPQTVEYEVVEEVPRLQRQVRAPVPQNVEYEVVEEVPRFQRQVRAPVPQNVEYEVSQRRIRQEPIVERKVIRSPPRIIENVTEQDIIEKDIIEQRIIKEQPEYIEEVITEPAQSAKPTVTELSAPQIRSGRKIRPVGR
jgi:hypothetical protein